MFSQYVLYKSSSIKRKSKPLKKLFFFEIVLFLSLNYVSAESVKYIHTDHLGSSSMVTDEKGELVSNNTYYPYGNTNQEQGTSPTERKYTGQISDQDQTNLYYYNARYYNPKISKFTQADFTSDSQNRYLYVKGNPLRFTDPSGLLTCEDIGNPVLKKLCQLTELFMIGITGSNNSSMDYEDAKWVYYGNRFENNNKFFSVNYGVDPSVVDLIKYRAIYEGIWIAANENLFNQPWASTFMYLFLHGNGDDIDLSDQLDSYAVDNMLSGNTGEGLEYPAYYGSMGDSGKLKTSLLPFLDTPETIGDTFHALGISHFTVDPQGSKVMNGIYWYNDQPILGTYIENPKITLYDVYDWDKDVSLSWFLPVIGEVSVDNNIGRILTENNLGTPFNVSAEVQLQGRYFFMTQHGFYDFDLEHEKTQFYEKWKSY